MNKHGQYVHKDEQKVTVCIRDGRISYETDATAIKDAEEEVQNALADLEKYNLQTQIDDLNDAMEDLSDSYDEMLDLLDDQIEKWEKISEFAENTANAELAAQYLGEDWVVRVITGNDEEIFENFKDLYVQNAEQIAQYDKEITTTENISALLTEYITAYEEETITYEEAFAAIESLLDQMNSDMTSGENLQNVLDYMALMNDTEATVSDVLVGLQTSLEDYADLLLENIQINYENGQQIADVRTSWDIMTDNIQDIRDYAEDILEAIEDLDFSYYYRSYDEDDDDDYSSSRSGGSSSSTSTSTSSSSSSNGGVVSNPYTTSNSSVAVHTDRGDVIVSGSSTSDTRLDNWDTGLEKGTIKSEDDISSAIMALGTSNLDSTAVPIVAHEGEMVITPTQQAQLLSNVEALTNTASVLSPLSLPAVGHNNNAAIDIQFGDIILPDVTDPDGFANAMGTQIESALRQAVSSIRI